MRIAIVGHGPSLRGSRLGPHIDACDEVVRLKYGHEMARIAPEDYGARVEIVCSTLKTWRPYYRLRPPLKEWWGYRNWPGQESELRKIELYYEGIAVRTEFEAVDRWLAVYRSLADVRVDHTDKHSSYAKEGDEPWFSTGTGAIVIACAAFRPREIVLAGFDNVLSGDQEGFRSVFREPGWAYPPHGWAAESRMLPLLSAEYGTRFTPAATLQEAA